MARCVCVCVRDICMGCVTSKGMVVCTQVIWYLVSDALPIRRAAKERYGEKVLTRTGDEDGEQLTLGHTTWGGADGKQDVFVSAAGENWLFGMADYHIISQLSGFGRTGAVRSMRWKNIWTMDDKQLEVPHSCANDAYTTLQQIQGGMGWYGI